jgi:TRAP-type C4-dicarboxylate transport system permease small subunit
MSSLKKGVEKIVDIFDHILCFFGCFFYMAFVVCVLVQVISRNFLPSAPSWTEEAARYSFIYMVGFGSAVAVHRNEFVNVEFLHDTLEPKFPMVNKVINLVIKFALLIFSGFVLINSVCPFAFIKFPMYSTAMTIPMQYVYFALVLMFAFMTIAYACEVVLVILGWNEKEGE